MLPPYLFKQTKQHTLGLRVQVSTKSESMAGSGLKCTNRDLKLKTLRLSHGAAAGPGPSR